MTNKMTNKEKFKEALKLCYEFKENTIFLKKLDLSDRTSGKTFRNFPAPWIKKTCEILKKVECDVVVEIGSTRAGITQKCINYYDDCENIEPIDAPPCCEDGHSTHFWVMNGFETHSVDIDKRCENVIKNGYTHHLKQDIPENLHIHTCDGIEFLKKFEKKIDFLFLDGWDVGSEEYQKRHLEAFLAAEDKLSDFHMISVDDTDWNTPEGGKDRDLYTHLIDNDYIRVIWGRQTVFIKIIK